jgi:hypothetical protein
METNNRTIDNPFDPLQKPMAPLTFRRLCGDVFFTLVNYGVFLKKKMFSPATFTFRGAPYRYFYGWYARTWLTERCVEIPIILYFMKTHRGEVLEVGNVLSHYFHARHPVIDKFEKAPGVINSDIEAFQSSKRFNLIISISTLEHVGLHDDVRDPKKVLRCIDHLRSLLAPNGTFIVTVPLGINPDMDRYLFDGTIPCAWVSCVQRTSLNSWEESLPPEINHAVYSGKWPGAHTIAVACIHR